jgi:hypothetical protein
MGAVFLAQPASHSERCQGIPMRSDRENNPTSLESVKIPGRYQVNIMPCMSTIMHGVEAVTPFSGGYRRVNAASFLFDALVPGFVGFFGSKSA